jgi:hypothetical protein
MGKHANTKIGFTPDKYIIIVMELTTKHPSTEEGAVARRRIAGCPRLCAAL